MLRDFSTTLIIIPARAGSQGVPGKNWKIIDGHPLISYTFHLAKQLKNARVVVTTDAEEVIELAAKAGLYYIRRAPELATHQAHISPVIRATLEHCEAEFAEQYQHILLLQPTAPLRSLIDIERCFEILETNPDQDGVVSLVEMSDIHPARMYHLDGEHNMLSLSPDLENAQRQLLSKVYLRNGCIFLAKKEAFLEQDSIIVHKKLGYVMDDEYWINIDGHRDIYLLESLIKSYKKAHPDFLQ